MKKRISVSVLIAIILLIVSICVSSITSEKDSVKTFSSKPTSENITDAEDEMRGLWVSFISLDMSNTNRSFETFQEKFQKIINEAKNMKCNTLIVQVRPMCDALYYSDIFPHSHILSGVQGKDPGYDALEYMCKVCHENDLSIHAWINPYRVKSVNIPEKLSNTNPYLKNKKIGASFESGIYLNPANKTARTLVTEGVKEIIENYDVDGIQFDDYFYPADCGDFDTQDYNIYLKSIQNITKAMTLDEWRINNVNLLITNVYKTIKDYNRDIQFGIAPQGNIDNDYSMGADIYSWSEVYGYVDYICPQMYYSVDNPGYEFEKSLQEWSEIKYRENIKVYVGLGAYKAGSDADSGTWLEKDDILATELILLRRYNFDGYMLYDYSALVSDVAAKELENFKSII